MNASAANATLTPADGNETVFDEWATEVVTAVYLYYTPLMVLLGCVGNALSVWVFYKSKLHHLSSSQYLTALAMSDTIFLLLLLPPWMSAARLSSLFHRAFWCQLFTYWSYVTCLASAWLVMAFTVERCAAVLRPLRHGACTTRRPRYVIISVLSFAVLINLPVTRFAKSRNGECSVDVDYEAHAARFNVVDMTLAFTVPMSVIVLLNGCITMNVCRLDHARRDLVSEREPGPSPPARSPRSQRRVTRMMVIVSSAFVVLNLPAYIIRIVAYSYGLNAAEVGGRWTALQQISLMCFHTNFAINFILYCISGQNFRRALMEALPCCWRRAPRAPTARSTEAHPARLHSVSSSFVSSIELCGEARPAGVRRRRVEDTRVTTEAEISAPAARPLSPERFIERLTFDTCSAPSLRRTTEDTRVTSESEASAPAARPRSPEHWTFENSSAPSLRRTAEDTRMAAEVESSAPAAHPPSPEHWTFNNSSASSLHRTSEDTRVTDESESSAPASRRRRPERFIRRWIFDNSNAPRPARRTGVASTNMETVELTTLSVLGRHTETAYIYTTQF